MRSKNPHQPPCVTSHTQLGYTPNRARVVIEQLGPGLLIKGLHLGAFRPILQCTTWRITQE
mgnify:CR=1 FL=1